MQCHSGSARVVDLAAASTSAAAARRSSRSSASESRSKTAYQSSPSRPLTRRPTTNAVLPVPNVRRRETATLRSTRCCTTLGRSAGSGSERLIAGSRLMMLGSTSWAEVTVRTSPAHLAVTMNSHRSNRPPGSGAVGPATALPWSATQRPRCVATIRSPYGVVANVSTRSSDSSHLRAWLGTAGRRRGQTLTRVAPRA